MEEYMFGVVSLCLFMLLLAPASSQATPAITCHCFTDRLYNPSKPALADPYFLATTQNTFFAALYNVEKNTIVMKKQTGSTSEDLWIAYWVASKSGSTGEALLVLRGKKMSWKEIIVPLGLSAKSRSEKKFAAELAAGASSALLAQNIVDDVLLRHRMLGEQELAVLRREWASNQEVIIASLIAMKTRRPAIGIYRDVNNKSKSWGALLDEAKIQPSGMQSEFAALLKK